MSSTEIRSLPTWPRMTRSSILSWCVIAVVAAILRLVYLDRVPLSETEAASAVHSLLSARGQIDSSGFQAGSPLFTHVLTAMLWTLGANDVAVRLTVALAGVALALTPWMLAATVGPRAAIVAGALLAISPVAIQTSRMADPAVLTATITMVIVAAIVRLATDRPVWAGWALAAGVGLALADESAIVVALATAAVAAGATWGWSIRRWSESLAGLRDSGEWRRHIGPALLAACLALVLATGAAMDLSGAGFIVGGLWGGVARVLTPAPFPTRNLATLLAYGWPILALAVIRVARAAPRGDHFALFLGQWVLLLTALAAVVGQGSVALAILPLGPAAILAGQAVADLVPAGTWHRLRWAAWGAALSIFLAVGGVLLAISQSVGAGRSLSIGGAIGLAALLAVVGAGWRSQIDLDQRRYGITLFCTVAGLAITIGSIGRLSLGGSQPGSEPLPREATDPRLRDVFRDLTLIASADPSRVLVIDAQTPAVVRWYGRDIGATPRNTDVSAQPFVIQKDTAETHSAASGQPPRFPWKVTSILNRADLNPLGIARWIVSRFGLVQGKPSDIIIFR